MSAFFAAWEQGGLQPAFACQPDQEQKASDAELDTHGDPHAAQAETRGQKRRQRQPDRSHAEEIHTAWYQRISRALEYAGRHDRHGVHAAPRRLRSAGPSAQTVISGSGLRCRSSMERPGTSGARWWSEPPYPAGWTSSQDAGPAPSAPPRCSVPPGW